MVLYIIIISVNGTIIQNAGLYPKQDSVLVLLSLSSKPWYRFSIGTTQLKPLSFFPWPHTIYSKDLTGIPASFPVPLS